MSDNDIASILHEESGRVIIPCWIQPRSSRNKIAGIYDKTLKVALTAPPVDGKANAELVKFFAKTIGVSKSAVNIISGKTSRKKLIQITGVKVNVIAGKLIF